MSKPPTPRSFIASIPRYLPGRSAEAAAAEHGLASAVKLASNESPFGPLPSVVDAIARAAAGANRYPDHAADEVAEVICARLGVGPTEVSVGCGSVGLLQQLFETFVGLGDEVVFPWPSFIAYPQFSVLVGADERRVRLRRQTPDPDAIVGAIDERTRLVVIANANNPTSTALRTSALAAVLEAAPPDCLVVVDEAYHEFATGADVPDALAWRGDHPNLAVLRTFSKAYGLAGLRIGYLVADESVVAATEATLTPFSVNRLAQAAAVASLRPEAEAELQERVDAVVAERARVSQAVRRMGWSVPDSQANFLWLPSAEASSPLAEALEREGVVTRPLGPGVRVTIGTPEENDRFLDALARVAAPIGLDRHWVLPTGERATQVADEIDALDAILQRLTALSASPRSGLTEPAAGESEHWDEGQVWAHVAEFGDYWLRELQRVVDAASDSPVDFGRVRSDPARIAAIAAGRDRPTVDHLGAVRRAVDRLRALLAELTEADWSRTGRHSTLGVMSVARQLEEFHTGHYRQHAAQLDGLHG